MDKELLRNGSGYVDFTAYSAIKNIERENGKMEYKRGEIFEYIVNGYEKRKALVVSANFRSTSRYISVIVLADEIKGENMVPVVCGGQMYADCGMVCFCTNERLGNYLRSASAMEMEQVDEGIARCLGIEQKTITETVEKVVEVPAPVATAEQETPVEFFFEELIQAKAEANVYKNLYEQLLAKVMA